MEQVEKSFLLNEGGCRDGWIMKKDTNKWLSTELYIHPYILLCYKQL